MVRILLLDYFSFHVLTNVQHTGIGFDQISGILAELKATHQQNTTQQQTRRDWKSYRMCCFLVNARSSRRRSFGNKHVNFTIFSLKILHVI